MNALRSRAEAEIGLVLVVAALLLGWAWLAAPVGELPRSPTSWDPLHSGRRFAEEGFLASKLQPRWAPSTEAAQYLTYTHYPPLPYWISGAIESAIVDPVGRIDASLRIVLCVALGALLCGYGFLRSLSLSPAAAAGACGVLVWSGQWWSFASRELTWVSWLQLFQLGAVLALGAAFAHWQTHARVAMALALAFAGAGALSSFDAWPWFPTLFAALALAAARGQRPRLRGLVWATWLAAGLSLGGAATRIAMNWWYFGSLEQVMQDVEEAYAARSTYAHGGLELAENRANYPELPQQLTTSHGAWVVEFGRMLPGRLAKMFLPAPPAARVAVAVAALLALPGWLLARRRAAEPPRAPWPGRLVWLVALALAGVPFALLCPAIAVQQVGPLMAFTPAVLLGLALAFEGLLAPLRARHAGVLARALGLALAAAAAASPMLREPEPSPTWSAPPAQLEAALRALAPLRGVVFVDLLDVNSLVFLAPLDASFALKPMWAQARFLRNARPLRVLRIRGQGGLPERELAKLQRIELAGLPEGFELWVPRPRR
jgi:hypothetical protein